MRSGILSISIDGEGVLPPIRVEFGGSAIVRVTIGCESLGRASVDRFSDKEHAFAERLRKDVSLYLNRAAVDFGRYAVDPEAGTEFQREVWAALRAIPYGQIRSYQWIARKIGRPGAVRAVGGACGANPIPIIQPCHRVVCSDGYIGGLSAGVDLKRMLLKIEGIEL